MRPESPTEPAAVVVDAHVHFWDPARLRYPWLDDVPALRRRYAPEQFPGFTGDVVDAVIAVEANVDVTDARGELAFLDALAADEPRIAGIVAFVDLTDEAEREEALAGLRAAKTHVVGVRQNIQGRGAWLCREPAFVRGVRRVGTLGLPFDLCATADQLTEVEGLVGRCPETRFVLDHCGKPAIRDNAYAPWADAVARIAGHANVCCKLSGLLTEARPDQHTEPALRPYLLRVLECFGVDRLLYASDWPVVTLADGAPAWRAIIEAFSSEWPAPHRRALFGENAIRVYDLSLTRQ